MGLMTLTYSKIDTPLLAAMQGPREAGIYFAAYGVIFAVQAVLTPLTRAAIPEMAKVEAGGANASQAGMFRLACLATAFSGVLAAGILVGADGILALLFGHDYSRGAAPLRLLAWSIPFTAASSILQQGLIVQDRHHRFSLLGGMAAVTNVGVNLCLIPVYGIRGAAMATIASEVVLFLGTVGLYRGHPEVNRLVFRLGTILLALGALGAVLELLLAAPARWRALVALACFGVVGVVGYVSERRSGLAFAPVTRE
jgi:O-antigen/teichoic acid export membrane protein